MEEHTAIRPRAEVVIPNWNRADLLRDVLESLDRQTVPIAVCVVDNGSTETSALGGRSTSPSPTGAAS